MSTNPNPTPSLLESTPPQPVKRANPIDMRDLYTLYYRKGQNPYPMAKNFYYKGPTDDPQKNLLKAIDVGRDHCDRITARFIRCVPLISDLSLDEQKYNDQD